MLAVSRDKQMDTITVTGTIQKASTVFERMLKETGDRGAILELQRMIYDQSAGGYLLAALDTPVKMPDGSLHEMALIKGDSKIELSATKHIGEHATFTITLDDRGLAFVKSYI